MIPPKNFIQLHNQSTTRTQPNSLGVSFLQSQNFFASEILYTTYIRIWTLINAKEQLWCSSTVECFFNLIFHTLEPIYECVGCGSYSIIPGITSVFEWKGALETDEELLLMIKTQTFFFFFFFSLFGGHVILLTFDTGSRSTIDIVYWVGKLTGSRSTIDIVYWVGKLTQRGRNPVFRGHTGRAKPLTPC